MTEKELIAAVADQTNQTKVVVKEILDAIADAIVEVGSKEESVRIAKLGTFKGVMTKSRQARNPRTGETVNVPAKKRLKFKRSQEL